MVISADESLSTLLHMEEKPKHADGPWLDPQLVCYMLQSFLPHASTEEERSYMLNNLLTSVQNEEDKQV